MVYSFRKFCFVHFTLRNTVNFGSRKLSDLYVTCQLIADNKPLTIPFRTSFKAFKNNYR